MSIAIDTLMCENTCASVGEGVRSSLVLRARYTVLWVVPDPESGSSDPDYHLCWQNKAGITPVVGYFGHNGGFRWCLRIMAT